MVNWAKTKSSWRSKIKDKILSLLKIWKLWPQWKWVMVNFSFETFLHSSEFYMSWSYNSCINRVRPAPVASERGCTFFLQLFTWLEDKHCTFPTTIPLLWYWFEKSNNSPLWKRYVLVHENWRTNVKIILNSHKSPREFYFIGLLSRTHDQRVAKLQNFWNAPKPTLLELGRWT